ncbi:ABC transporter substrate-binding protein [Streptomyces olivaceus]|uniref:ABC transporter substrate-binding protein n=1 Tax=Streptomyces olivaceus TaxID=47716 RepID=UPI001CCE6FD5|nr:ABC transporter substrate-binding protein [Streptomyces olivaceus]MBZ6177277.1 ABC transporter substrate-binding protein [Streptomyces olivaceus]MBZ6184179.1 ABC transporter substrate-binding protein [Streptomyces olivaceus]MBZ6250628.1 ABC transporter substrate-binding protein [Streptomyces olivaceus]
MPNRLRPAALALTLALAAAGCGANVSQEEGKGAGATAPSGGHYPVTVENCGEKKTFAKAPQRVVTNDVGITEIMFALGLEDHMAGYVMPDDKGDLTTVPWKDGYRKTKWLSKERINKELVLDARADLVFAGWSYGFNEGEGFTPAALRSVGVDSYLLSESCRNGQGKSRGVMAPLDALYTDLRNLGKVFDVEDRAETLVASFREQVAEAQAKAPKGADRPRVFLYDSGEDKPFTSGAFAGPHDIITKAGGDHVMKDLEDSWTTVGWETVVARDPEVIVINDYGDTTAEQKRKFLKSYKPLANVSAVKNDRFVTLDYVDLVESPRNPAAISALAEELR